MTQRARRFVEPSASDSAYVQRAVESRRRGDVEQIRLYTSHKESTRCQCGYTTTKMVAECPLCGRGFANGFANGRAARVAALSAAS